MWFSFQIGPTILLPKRTLSLAYRDTATPRSLSPEESQTNRWLSLHKFAILIGPVDALLWAVSIRLIGAPGEIRTPDLVVRSHALENALQPINTGIILLRTSHSILNF